jgi:hypothetical protein
MLRTSDGRFVYVPDGKVLNDYFWDRSRLGIIQGPIGSGTSSASLHKIWRLANEQEPDWDGVRRTKWIVARETYKQLKTTILATTWPIWFPEDEWGAVERSEPAVAHLRKPHPSGDGTRVECDITFLAIPDETVAESILASFEITGFFYNEGQNQNLGVIVELLSRCGRFPSMKTGPGATWFGGMIDLNAPVEGHWIPYMRGDVPLPPDWTDEQKAQFKKPDNWSFFVQPPGLIEKIVDGKPHYEPNADAENQRWLKEPYIEKIQGWDKDRIDRRVLNKVGLSRHGLPVYPTFMADEHVASKELEPIDGLPIIVGLDFGREPAAVFMQNRVDNWRVLSELVGTNEAATDFAPRVARHLAQHYAGFHAEFYGDPRGADRGQNTDVTAYDIFMANGMRVQPATIDNNPEMRRSTVNNVLKRRYGLTINPSCLTLKTGMAGGYYYRKIATMGGGYSEKPAKNEYSHIVEAMENALMGGGENPVAIPGITPPKPRVGVQQHRRVQWRTR